MSLEAYEEAHRHPKPPTDVISIIERAVTNRILELERREREARQQPAPDVPGDPVERPAEPRHRG